MSSTSPAEAPGGREPGRDASGQAERDGGVPGLDAHLGYWLRAVSNHVSYAFQAKVEVHGVTVAEWVVLRALFDAPGTKPSELAAKLGLTRGAISKLVDRLVSKDLVAVRSDAHDGRAQVLTLNAAGRALVPKLAALAEENDAEAFGHLGEEERARLLTTLQVLVERLGIRAVALDRE